MKNFLISNDNERGLIKALNSAQQICKRTKGRIATMPDLARMRANRGFKDPFWNIWALVATTIYFGSYKGKRLIVVAHHFGPLTTEERLLQWGSSAENSENSDRTANGFKGSPKITQEEFNHLVEGKYGEVRAIDFDEYQTGFPEHLSGFQIKIQDALNDPLLEAMLSTNREDYEIFLSKCHSAAQDYAEEQKKEDYSWNKILQLSVEDSCGCSLVNKFSDTVPFPETPVALMLLFQRASRYGNHDLSVSTELHTEESVNGYQQVVVLNDEEEDLIKIDFNPEEDWAKCLVSHKEGFENQFFSLAGEKNLFVEYPKRTDGAYMDTGQIMFPVTNVKEIGEPTAFTTEDCLFFLKYHIDEVKKIAPESANSYRIIGEVQGRGTVQVPIQFYSVTPLTEKRILRREEVMDDLDLLLEINNQVLPV